MVLPQDRAYDSYNNGNRRHNNNRNNDNDNYDAPSSSISCILDLNFSIDSVTNSFSEGADPHNVRYAGLFGDACLILISEQVNAFGDRLSVPVSKQNQLQIRKARSVKR